MTRVPSPSSLLDDLQDVGTAKSLQRLGIPGLAAELRMHRCNHDRAIYTVRLRSAVYVLHCFQKKNPKGGKIPLVDARLLQQRLREAEAKENEADRRV